MCAVQHHESSQNTACAPQMWLQAPNLFAIRPLASGPQSLCRNSNDGGAYQSSAAVMCDACAKQGRFEEKRHRAKPGFCLFCAQKVALIEGGLFDSGDQEGALQVSRDCHTSPVHNCICHLL